MKNQKLEEQINKLIKEITLSTGKPFHYESCPHINDCSMPLAQECISVEYKECSYYKYYVTKIN